MNSILTPDEISALMKQNQPSNSREEELTLFFKPFFSLLEEQFVRLLGLNAKMESCYVQKLSDGLKELVYEHGYVTPIQLSLGEVLVVISKKNGEVLSNLMGVSTEEALTLVIEECGIVIGEFLSGKLKQLVTATTYQSTLMNQEQITSLPVGLPSYVISFNLSFENADLELKVLLTNEISKNILTRASGDFVSDQVGVIPVQPFQFSEIKQVSQDGGSNQMELVNDVTVEVSAELGNTTMTLGRLMLLEVGDTVALNKLAGDLADVYVNGQNIAKAEVTVLDDNFGLRVVELVPPKKQFNS